MHEIITIQLGQQSNYVATHFWNAQESYFTYSEDQEPLVDHDVHWRPGIGADGSETYMPRTVIYDLKGGFGSMRKINALYEAQAEGDGPPQALWNGRTVVQREPAIQPSAYQQSLETGQTAHLSTSSVRYWSDFSRVFYHPRSVVQLHEYELGSSLRPFESWAAGQELFADLDREHDLADRDLRPFVEEADQMQAVQVVATFDDAWGGFAARYLERLRDEYGKTTLWVWGLQEGFRGVTKEKRLTRLANKARTLAEVYKQASLVVPITVPPQATLPRNVRLDASSPWHSSALIAAAIESVTLPSRLKDAANRDTLGGMADILNAMGKQSVAGLQMTASRPATTSSANRGSQGDRRQRPRLAREEDEVDEGVHLDIDFSPSDQLESSSRRQNGYHKPRVFSQVVVRRDVEEEGEEEEDAENRYGNDLEDPDGGVRNRRLNSYGPVTKSYSTPLPFPLLDSYPQIFHVRNQDAGGDEDDEDDNDKVGITAALSTDASVSERLKQLRTTVARSIGIEDRETLGNDLAEMADEYHEGWSSGSDEGDDD